ncbi:MAG: universal stress protein [Legionellaceae bacterium]|nr:universal stress protein [Legionellaceae bacterium]
MAFKRILVTTDFSKHANYALKRAIEFAEQTQAELSCLHVVNQNWFHPFSLGHHNDKDAAREEAESAHAAALEKIAAQPYPVHFTVLTGRIPDKISQYVSEHQIDMVFMGAHGSYYLNDYILGTNAQSVIKHSKIPVQLIKKEPTFAYQRILVTTDFSDASKKAVETAYQLYPHAKFLILHIADVWYGKYLDDSAYSRQLDDEMGQSLENKLQLFLKSCQVDQRRFSLKFIGGYPANDIVKYAAIWNAQLVVAGTRGHSLLHYIFVGRVTERLLRTNDSDMLIVPP